MYEIQDEQSLIMNTSEKDTNERHKTALSSRSFFTKVSRYILVVLMLHR